MIKGEDNGVNVILDKLLNRSTDETPCSMSPTLRHTLEWDGETSESMVLPWCVWGRAGGVGTQLPSTPAPMACTMRNYSLWNLPSKISQTFFV